MGGGVGLSVILVGPGVGNSAVGAKVDVGSTVGAKVGAMVGLKGLRNAAAYPPDDGVVGWGQVELSILRRMGRRLSAWCLGRRSLLVRSRRVTST